MRAVIYARYSSDQQRDASIDDQIEVCKRYIDREGWRQIEIYEDRALSGSSAIRPGYQRMLIDGEAKRFDVIVVEALDRLGRNLADIAALHDRLSFAGIRLHAIATGEVTPMHVGMLGTMAQMYLSDLREKTKRGQLGRALQGRIPGGKAYGYDVVEPRTASRKAERGERRINEAEAAVVLRIFEAYAGGSSPRAIAKQLNAAGIPGPGGRPWGDTTIRGQIERGTGILNNALYAGRLEWNRCSYVKNPRTGKRVARPNPRQLWEVVEVPELRIVPDALWEQVKARQKTLAIEIGRTEEGQALNRAHRRRFLLSGLLKCGVCGGGYTIVAKDRYGCATRRTQGICDNSRTIVRREIEARVLVGLKDRLLAPELVETFLAEYQEETNRLRREADAAHKAHEREFAQVKGKIARIVHAIEDGMYTPSMKEAMHALEARKAELEALLADRPDAPALRLHPKLAELYAGKVARLEEALDDPVDGRQAAEIIRGMIDRIVLTPGDDGLAAELYGDIASILSICGEISSGQKKLPGTDIPGSQLSVVAGVGFEPTTFRL
jgi:DNA invertase Pin-like site-specific DNA recombinase